MNSKRHNVLHFLHSVGLGLWIVLCTLIVGTILLVLRIFSRDLAHRFGVVWCRLLTILTGIKLTVEGLEHVSERRSYLYVSNHSSALDILVLQISLPHPLLFMAKKELFRIPIFGWAMAVVGEVPIDRAHPGRARASVERAKNVLTSGMASLIAFPEGTRTRTGELGPFKLGAFSLAIKAQVPIVPVCIRGTFESLPKGTLLIRPTRVTVRIGRPISVEGFGRHDKSSTAKAARKQICQLLGSS